MPMMRHKKQTTNSLMKVISRPQLKKRIYLKNITYVSNIIMKYTYIWIKNEMQFLMHLTRQYRTSSKSLWENVTTFCRRHSCVALLIYRAHLQNICIEERGPEENLYKKSDGRKYRIGIKSAHLRKSGKALRIKWIIK